MRSDPLLHIFISAGKVPKGAVALCGYVKRDGRQYKTGDSCPECAAFKARKPTSDTGIYLHKHEHVWLWILSRLSQNGEWHPVYECLRCEDVLVDLHVDPKTWKPS